MSNIEITTLSSENWEEYKNLRLTALKENPEAFGLLYEEAKEYSKDKWLDPLVEAENEEK